MTDNEQKKIFSRNLNNLLITTQKTQKEVADAIGVSAQTFNTWCVGIALPRMGKIQKLSDYFNIGKSDLLDDKSNDKEDNNNDITKKLNLDTMRQLNDNNISKVNKYAENLLNLQQMEEEPVLMAAHHDNPTPEEQEKIMRDMDTLKRPTK